MSTDYPTIADTIGNTPLVRLQRLGVDYAPTILLKMEGNNPAGSVKDRPAINMIDAAEQRGEIQKGDTLIEATSGNTGIALAMAAAIKGYPLLLLMPINMSDERKAAMKAFGAELQTVSAEAGMEGARDLALELERQGRGKVLNQFANQDNPNAHYTKTAEEIWHQTSGKISHFISAMGTTGTIMGCSRYFKTKNNAVQIIGVQPEEGAKIAGIRRWSPEYLPKFYEPKRIDKIIDISQTAAEDTTRALAQQEGIWCGVSSGGAVAVCLQLAQQLHPKPALIVTIICDRGDRYLSTGLFPP